MQIRVVNKESLLEYNKRTDLQLSEDPKADIVVFPFHGLTICYDKELKGESRYFEQAALLSKRLKATVVCGCVTNTRGHMRKSALVAQEGKIVGVSDMLHAVNGEVSSGATLSVYNTPVGKMGVVVAGDLQSYKTVEALSLCGSDFLVCVQEKPYPVYGVLIRAWAYCLGLPVLLSAAGYAGVADELGTLAFSSPQAIAQVQITPSKEYHLIQTRRRGKR